MNNKFLRKMLGLLSVLMLLSGSIAAAEGLTGDLVYWSNWNNTETQGKVMEEAAAEFMSLHPGVTITIVNNGRENRSVVLPALEAGQQVDLMDQNIDFAVTTWKDFLLDLDAYYAADTAMSEALRPVYIDLLRSKDEDGRAFGIPYQPNTWGIFYNKDHFAQAGIEKVPETWTELMDACEKLVAAGFIPMTTDDAYADIMLGFHLCRYKGSEWVERLVNGEESWEDPQVMQALKDFENMVANEFFPFTVAANIWPAGQQEIALGEVSMYLNGSWLPNEVMATAGEDFPWGAFSWPAVDGGTDGVEATCFGSQVLCVNKNTASPDAAVAFAKFVTTGAYDQKLSAQTYAIPMDQTNEWPAQLVEVENIFATAETRYPASTTIRSNADKNSLIKEEFLKLLGGTITAEDFVATMQK